MKTPQRSVYLLTQNTWTHWQCSENENSTSGLRSFKLCRNIVTKHIF